MEPRQTSTSELHGASLYPEWLDPPIDITKFKGRVRRHLLEDHSTFTWNGITYPSIEHAAQRYKVTATTFRRWLREGHVPPPKHR